MALPGSVTPNRRGIRSRQLVLDAAERVMAEEGFEAATLARVVAESGVHESSVYHYFGSKDGILLAVMERGAERFFADLPNPDRRVGRPVTHIRQVVAAAADLLQHHPNFLRLMLAYAIQPKRGDAAEVEAVVERVRELALARLRHQFALAFDEDPSSETIDQLARFALTSFDGAFVAAGADRGVTLQHLLEPLPPAIVAARRALRSKAPDG
ncbi:MAG: TetR/AcrR family transcriptional regulator [Solirubrobacteraceae bacterium]